MLTPATFQHHSAQILKPDTTPDARKSLLAEVRDSFEVVHTQYAAFLHNFLPAFKAVLTDFTTPQNQDNVIQKTRAITLEILSRLPHNNVLREKILDVYTMAMSTLKNDNENNAVTALRIIFELHKNDRHQLGGQVQPFLDYVKQLYESFGKTVETRLVPVSSTPSAPAKPPTPQIFPSTQSFKVITECPLLVMFVLQLYPNLVPANVQQLLPLMVRALQFTVPSQMIPTTSKQVFHELIASQVKTLSFLAYLLKQYPEKMTGDELSVPRSVVKLMQTCPGEAVGVRKELLVATRHILASRFRRGFFDQIDLLLDEKILVGTGRTGPGTLRPLGYSFLAELVHCVRLNLTVPQLEKIIFLFSANVHDPNFSYTLQTKSVRLLLNLIEGILKVDHSDANQRPAARELLIRILETLVAKYIALGEQVPKLLDSVVSMRSESDPVAAGKRLSEVPQGDPLKEITDFKTLLKTLTLGLKTVIWSAINIRITNSSASKTAPSTGLPPNSQNRKAANSARQSIRTGLLEKECEIVARLLPAGRNCFRLYSRHEKANGAVDETKKPQPSGGSSDPRKSMPTVIKDQTPAAIPDLISEYTQAAEPSRIVAASFVEEKEVFDQFAQIFTVLDPPSFQDVFGLRIPDLFEYIVENGAAVTIPQLFLANSSVSKYFADIMFNFLVENMKYLDVPYQDASQKITNEGKRANCLLKLFKILFASVSLFPANEPVLRLHLHSIVKNCLRHAAKAQDPHAYLQMLRALFKSVTNGKYEAQFDLLYRDFMPLVEPIFSHLLGMYSGPSRLLHRELIIELCLMVPARPSTIFPYIEQQIKPIVWALDGGKENPMYGLRTLEFWVDMLQPAYLRLLLANVEPDLSRALHRHLRPPGNPFGPGALRILGKLGSRSRNQVSPLAPFRLKREVSSAQILCMDWQDGLRLNLETDDLIHLASEAVLDLRERESVKYTTEYKRQAWKFLFGCFCKFLGFHERSGKAQRRESKAPTEEKLPAVPDQMTVESDEPGGSEQVDNIISRKKPAIQLASCLLKTLLASAKLSELNEANSYVVSLGGEKQNPERAIENICQYFALRSTNSLGITVVVDDEPGVDLARHPSEEKRRPESPVHSSVFFDALVDSISLENRGQTMSGLECLRFYVREVIALFNDAESVAKAEHVLVGPGLKSNDDHKDSSTKHEKKDDPSTPRADGKANPKAPEVHVSAKNSNAMDIDSPGKCPEAGENITGSEKCDSKSLSSGSPLVGRALAPLVDKLCHCCHGRTWNIRWAGTHGLNILLSLTPVEILSSSANRPTVVRCFTALLSVGRLTTDFSNEETLDLVSTLLQKVISILFKPREALAETGKPNSSTQSNFASSACKILAADLSSRSANARSTAKMCFRAIAETEGRDICDILLEVRDEILKPLRERPIRQHQVGIQIGYLSAINFCMELGQQNICDELFSTPFKEHLLVDSMHIVDANNFDPSQDADDGFRARYHDNKYLDGKTSGELVILRRAVLDFLCNVSVRCSSVLQDVKHEQIFQLMISCFFRSLQSRDEEMVQSAKRGLKHAISKHPKPKELLQNNLRPVLGNLGDYKKLTLQYLQGLNRVLELFSHWFNVNLGEKLLEHLQHWTEPEKLPPLKKMMAGSESKVAAAILDLFHLLPSAASKFLEQIVQMVLKLEAVIALAAPGAAHLGLKNTMGASTSPYRTPLLKFSSHHASAASRYFLSKLDDDRVRQLFFVMVRSAESELLRKELMETPKRLLSIAHFSLDDDDAGKTLHVVTLIDLLSRHKPNWLKTDADVMAKLSSYWKVLLSASELRQNNSRSLSRVRTVKLLADIFIRYCRQFAEEINILFELVPILSMRTICDFTFVKNFLHSSVTQTPLHPNRKGILTRFLTMFQDKSQSQEALARALKYIVTPMVKSHLQSKELEKKRQGSTSKTFDSSLESGRNFRGSASTTASPHDVGREEGLTEKGSNLTTQPIEQTSTDEILDSTLIQRIMTEVLDQPDDVLLRQEESLSAELLQFATVLLQYMPKEVGPHKKEIIKFGWDHLKREESVAKQWAFVNVSRFFRAYKAPVKIILQVYVALLRTKQGDCKELVQEALDVLTPALPFRLAHNPTDNKYPLWIRYTKKILLEEGHSVPNLVHIWQLIARHPGLFYFARAPFVPIMVNSLNRIGLNNTTPSVEYRRLALDLVQLIVGWEKERRLNKASSSDREREATTSITNAKKRIREGEAKTPELELVETSRKSGRVGGAEPPAKIRKSEDSQAVVVAPAPTRATASPGPKDADDFTPSQAMVDVLINFLTQVLFRPMDRREAPILTRRCILLLEEALSLWPGATVRLQFVEKLLAPISQEKSQASVGLGPATKPVDAAGAGDANNAESKSLGKGEAVKDEKAEQARQKRLAARHSALMTSILLARVFARHLRKRFVLTNITAIRILVAPAICEGSLQAASQFGSLLEQILQVCSASPNVRSNAHHSQSSMADAKSDEAKQVSNGNMTSSKQETKSQSVTNLQAQAGNDKKKETAWIEKLLAEISVAIEACIKSSDTTKNHCGMIVLKAFAAAMPHEFPRYQESLAKALHRMTKENLSSTQPQAPGGGASGQGSGTTGPQRSIVTTEKTATLGANPNPRGSAASNGTQVQEQGPGTDSLRGTKTTSGQKNGQQKSKETRALLLSLSLLGENISTLEPGQRKTLFHVLWALIDRCVQVEVLLEIVRIVETWVFWKPSSRKCNVGMLKEPLAAKDKVHILLKMITFDRISGHGSQELMNSYLMIILRIFGGGDEQDKRLELIPKLERAFMLGLKSTESPLRKRFFHIYDTSVDPSLALRLNYVIAKQDWEHLSESFWIKYAVELILSAVNRKEHAGIVGSGGKCMVQLEAKEQGSSNIKNKVLQFNAYAAEIPLGDIIEPLLDLCHFDPEVAHRLCIMVVPKTWENLTPTEQMSLERSIALLLTKEYHQVQASWRRNNIQSLLEAVGRCKPLPVLRSDVVRHLGSRWNAWYSALNYFDGRERSLSVKLTTEEGAVDNRQRNQVLADLEDVYDAQTSLFSALHERDYVAGLWKHRAKSRRTTEALCLEQIGLHSHAQETYSEALSEQIIRSGVPNTPQPADIPGRTEVAFWEERWIECARSLCQWEVLTEFSRTVVNSKLLHECLWRLPDWSALKELLIKNPVEDGPQLKIYQAYVHLQENKLEVADNFITQGYLKAQEKFCSLPESFDLDACSPILVQFQQLVELQESTRVLSELNALSRHGASGVNVDQKIDNIRLILNTWRERLPSVHEPLPFWNDVLTWRNHVHAVVVNVLDALKEAASAKVAAAQVHSSTGGVSRNAGGNAQAAQVQAAAAIATALSQQVLVMGVNETAWNVHRFGKACRKQGYPDVALYVLQKMYPFGTMELTEYFVKTKETARSFMDGPKGLDKHVENGLHELNRCNMDHFNSRQKAQLFTIKGKLYMALGKEDDAVEAFSTALHTSPDVGSAWLVWGQHCDTMQDRAVSSPYLFSKFSETEAPNKSVPSLPHSGSGPFAAELAFREAAVSCYIQAARFGSRKLRGHFPRILRLLSIDLKRRLLHASERQSGRGVSGNSERNQSSASGTMSRSAGGDQRPVERSPPAQARSTTATVYGQGVSRVITENVQEMPAWMWLPWIPHLVSSLRGREGIVWKPLLVRLAHQYPQALFYPLKSFMEERKLIEKPVSEMHRDAMKLSRPITAALKMSATPAHLTNAARQTQEAKESAHRANQRLLALRKDLENLEKAVAASKGNPDHTANLAGQVQLKNEIAVTQRKVARCIQAVRAATQRQRHIKEMLTGNQFSQGEKQDGARKPGKQSVAKQDQKSNAEGSGHGNLSESGPQKSNSIASTSAEAGAVLSTPFELADFVMTELVKSHQEIHYEMDLMTSEISTKLKPSVEENIFALMNNLLYQCYNLPIDGNKDVINALRKTLEDVGYKYFGVRPNGQVVSDERQSHRAARLRKAFQSDLAPQTARDFPTDIEGIISRLRRWQGNMHRDRKSQPVCYRIEDISKYLMQVNDSGVEVFGQYWKDEFSEPSVDNHIKIAHFCSDVKVLDGPTGRSRSFHVMGSDGRAYHFVVETGTKGSIQIAEERMSQLYRLLNCWIFGKNCECQRRRIRLSVPMLMGIGNKVRLISYEPDTGSLASAVDEVIIAKRTSTESLIGRFREVLVRKQQTQDGTDKRSSFARNRKAAYSEICSTHVPDWCLSRMIMSRTSNSTANFVFRKRLGESVGYESLVSYIFGVEGRGPERLMISWKYGIMSEGPVRLLTKNMRLGGSGEGVPFRLTRNLEKAIGQLGVNGGLFGCMATSLNSMREEQKLIECWMDLMARDELQEVVKMRMEGVLKQAGSSVKFGAREMESAKEKMLDELMSQVKSAVTLRLSGKRFGAGLDKKEKVIQLCELLASRAQNVDKQLEMDTSWQAWI